MAYFSEPTGGLGDYVSLGSPTPPSGVNEFSVVAWAERSNTTPGGSYEGIIAAWTTGYNVWDYVFRIGITNQNDPYAVVNTSGGTMEFTNAGSSWDPGELHMISVVYDDAVNFPAAWLYFDATLIDTENQNGNIITPASPAFAIGMHPSFPSDVQRRRWFGWIYQVRIYHRALSAQEIASIYAARGGDNISQGLEHLWEFDEGPPGSVMSGTIRDKMKNPYNGSPVNNPEWDERRGIYRFGSFQQR